jgi:selenocysteine-specific elongation factor
MYVIGTAGHIDHGKSALVLALTGIDPDRLPEEKERGMTIDLGFAWMTLSDGVEVGIVDVPGHERFVKNMIAGVGGIDAVLFVVAADDGWMPQTQEHLEILNLLKIKKGIVVINKIDLVKPDWLELVVEDIKEKIQGTILSDAPVVRVSATQKTGIDQLKQELNKLIIQLQPRKDLGKPRVYIDRVFTVAGMGTVVTGTLMDGSLYLGEEIEILPQKIKAKIRNLQSHKKDREKILPGTRVAINLSGIEKEEVMRGNVIAKPEQDISISIFEAKIFSIPHTNFTIKNNSELLVILGTTEVLAKAIILDKEEIPPGNEGLVQFRLKEPVVARMGDHFIVRLPSPGITLAGGKVLNLFVKKHKRQDEEVIKELKLRENMELKALLLSELFQEGFSSFENLLKYSNFSQEEIKTQTQKLIEDKIIFKIDNLIVEKSKWETLLNKIKEELRKQHQIYPYKLGLNSAELCGKIKKEKESFVELGIRFLVDSKEIVAEGAFLRMPGHQPQLIEKQKNIAQKIFQKLSSDPLSAPTKEEILTEFSQNPEVLSFLIQTGEILELKDGILLCQKDFENIKNEIVAYLKKNQEGTVSKLREHLKTTRKYMVPILEKLDQLGITQREGDKRLLK